MSIGGIRPSLPKEATATKGRSPHVSCWPLKDDEKGDALVGAADEELAAVLRLIVTVVVAGTVEPAVSIAEPTIICSALTPSAGLGRAEPEARVLVDPDWTMTVAVLALM